MTSSKLPIMYVAAAAAVSILATPAKANGNFCGTTWNDAVSRCARDCPSGAPSQCASGETCFAGTPVSYNFLCSLFFFRITRGLNLYFRDGFISSTQCVSTPQTPQPTQRQTSPPIAQQQSGNNVGGGTCGGGNLGNGICPNADECCSRYGFCGSTPEYCTQPASSPTGNVGQNVTPSTGEAGTCGGGNVGNGICPNSNECCSQFGFCGTTPEHCSKPVSTPPTPSGQNFPPSTGGAAPSVYGTCGGGNVGNGICPNNNECCSQFGL